MRERRFRNRKEKQTFLFDITVFSPENLNPLHTRGVPKELAHLLLPPTIIYTILLFESSNCATLVDRTYCTISLLKFQSDAFTEQQ